jgi:hypothetical protein
LRILDDEADKKLNNISVFLTKEEAVQLRSYLNQLLENPKLHHVHLSSNDYQKEITVCIYNEESLENFHSRAIKLIKEDK